MPRDTRTDRAPVGYTRPPVLSPDLVLIPVGEDGEPLGSWDFNRLPCAQPIREALAEVFAAQVDVGGPWRRPATVQFSWDAVGNFLRWLESEGHHLSSLSELTRATWDEYVIGRPPGWAASLSTLRRMLVATGQLQPRTALAVNARQKTRTPQVQPSLTTDQARRVLRVGHEVLDAAHERILGSWTLLEEYRAGRLEPDTDRGRWGALLAHVEEHLDVPRVTLANGARDIAPEAARLVGRRGVTAVERLFLTPVEAGAVMSLIGLHEGWNPDMWKTFTVDDVRRADSGDEGRLVYNIGLDKPRLGAWRHIANTLVETGPRTGASVLRQVLEITAPGRRVMARRGTPLNAVLIYSRTSTNGRQGALDRVTSAETSGKTNLWRAVGLFSDHVNLRDEAGQPVRFHRRMLRRTNTGQVRPQGHSEATNLNVYQLHDATVREESKDVTEDGLNGALDHATLTVTVLRATAEASQQDADLDPDTAHAIDSGVLDTPVGACKDVDHSPLSNHQTCRVSFLLCFICTNAVVVPRHLPRLVYLHQRLEGLREHLADSPAWVRWAPHWLRLTDLLNRHFTAAEREDAARRITDEDRALIDNTLARRYDT